MKNQRRKVTWDRGGVSEVIGTILTLSITVVLFSGIIAMVDQFPAPGDNVYTDFTATIEPRDSWNNGARIHITNTGGQPLDGMWGLIAITIDSHTYSLKTKGIYDNMTYGLGIPLMPGHSTDNGDDIWDTGERWTFYRNQTQISQNSDVNVVILDIGRGAMLWTSQIQGKRNTFGPIISNIRADSDTRSLRSDPIAFGREFYLFADIYDPEGDLDPTSIHADLSSFLGMPYTSIPMTDPDGDGTFTAGPIMGPDSGFVPIGYHIAIVRASDTSGMQSSGSARVAVGLDLEGQPNLVITERDIIPSSYSPVNGQTVSISVTVKNYGGWCNGILRFYDIVGSSINDIGTVNFTISQGPTQLTRTISWLASPGGEHRIMAFAEPIGASDPSMDDNSNYTNVTVLPKILLVDDDNYPPDLSDMDAVSYMRGALESSDFTYDLYTVSPHKDGPGYMLGQTKLVDYDVVIWMTGYETVKTLTPFDQQNLTSFLNDDLGRGRGGNLWLIGQYLYSDPAIPAAFFANTLKASSFTASPTGPTDPLMGIAGNPISDEWNSTFIPMTTRVPGKELSYRIIPDTAAGAEMTFKETDPATYADVINYRNATKDSRVVFSPWEFSRISDTGDQTQFAYRVLKWLGNITVRHGKDLAISEQTVDPSFVFFNQQVRVDAIIRNNGEEDLATQVGLFLDGKNEPISWISSILVPGRGGSITVSANWTAKELGKHVLKWKVDPNNLIAETNENNNEVPDYITSGLVFVEFRILVVDDDASANNLGTLDDDTGYLTDSLHRLGYTFESPGGVNTTFVVNVGENGPTLDLLKDYSAVFWICGNSPAGLTLNDTVHLSNYINNYKGMLWLSGNDIWSGVPDVNLTADMGINSVIEDMILPVSLRGADNSPISHGMNISIAANTAADILVPETGANGVFYQSVLANRYCAIMQENMNYKGFTSSFNMSTFYGQEVAGLLTGDNATDEFVYMLLRWFGKPETRSEVRITERDFSISDHHPQIGGAYIIRATVHNVGVNDANILVRFLDGTVQVGSDSISITPGSRTTAEIIWRPIFAGQRMLHIQIDPVNEVDEVFQWFNNNRSFSIYVYFFWDDMESGASKWTHASTIIKINGEAALDYFGSYTSMNTDISTTWNASRSYGTQMVTNTAHSYPNSYYMHEGVGLFGKADVLISFAIDDSRSMSKRYATDGQTWLEKAKNAVLLLLNELSDDSVCVSIWDFEGNNERRWSGPTENVGGGRLQTDPQNHNANPRPPVRLGDLYTSTINGTTINGRQLIRDEITALDNPPGQTIMWDAIGEAYLDTQWFTPLYPNLMPVVIVLSDGADSQASDESPIAANRIEGGSDYWCPWDFESNGMILYTEHRGKYTFDWMNPSTSTQWLRGMTHGGSMEYNRVGLLGAGMKIFTIGLGLEHHENPWEPVRSAWPGEIMDNLYATCTGPGTKETGTLEYNLWRIANTTGAMYFYAPTGDELGDIFTQLGMYLATGFNQTRSSDPQPETRAVHNNADKRAVTEEFSLVDIEKATLSFWQRYNILQGGNGAFLQVGYKESANGEWKYKYMTPPGQYTGMIFYQYNVYDDFGNLIRWGWNGISGQGSFGWDRITLDISSYVPQGHNALDGHVYRSQVCIAFNYTQFGGGTNVGWYIDDIQLDVTRSNMASIVGSSKDLWSLSEVVGAHSGTHCWSNIDPITGHIKTGVDNYLMTAPIDLTNARNAYLSAYFRFNFNQQSAAPPDGFRVEVTTDRGQTWIAINLGVRSGWGVSGTGPDSEDTVIDGRSYTGITDTGNAMADNYWVGARTLGRLNVDLSAWSGNQIHIRFRMVSNNLPNSLYPHNNNAYSGDPGFGGFFIDDVNVYGETIFG